MQPQHTESQAPRTLYSSLGPVWSDVTIFGTILALPLAIVLIASVRWGRNRWRARAWKAALRDAERATEGDTVLRGTVELAANASMAVRVEVTQTGTENYSGDKVTHKWKEVGRKITANPFYIAEASGRRTRVEPSEDVLLVDRLDQIAKLEFDRRIRAAELSAGEPVFAVGSLQRGHDPEAAQDYRGASTTMVLRPPRKGRMILATEPLHARFERTARTQGIWMVFMCVVIVVFQLFAVPYHLRHWFGETVAAEVVDKREFVTTGGHRGGATGHHVITTQVGESQDEYDLASDLYDSVSVGDSVWIRRVPWWPSNQQLGARATASAALAIVSTILVSIFAGLYFFLAWLNRPWWEKPLNQKDSGPL